MNKTGFLFSNINNVIKKNISGNSGKVLSKPLQISIQPNEKCNAKCIMCDCWKEKNDYLTSQEIINSLKELKKWVGSNFFVQIAGGEPLIFKGIYDIFKFCADNDIICKISTNGIALTENTCNKIIESGLKYLSVSLDSHLPEIHDKYRGVPGTLERAVNGIKYLKANSNITIGVSSILMRDNISTFNQTVDYFLSLPIDRLLIQPIRVWTEGLPIERWNEYEYWVNDQKDVEDIVKWLKAKKVIDNRILNTENDFDQWQQYFANPGSTSNKGVKKCKVSFDRITINYKGEVYMGCTGFTSIGNIKETPIKTMWKSETATKVRQNMMQCKIPCTSNCFKELSFTEKVKKGLVLMKSGLFK